MEQHKQTMNKEKDSPQKTPPKNTTEERPKEPPSPAAKLLTRRALAGKGSKRKGKGKTKAPEINVSSAKSSNSSVNLTFGLTDSTLSDSGYQKITSNRGWWHDLGKSLQNVSLSKLMSEESEDSMDVTEDSLQFPTPVHKKPRRAVKRVSTSQFHGVMDVTQASDKSTRSSTLSVAPEVVSEDTDQSDSSTEMPVTRRKRLAHRISKGVFMEAVGSSSMRVSKSPKQSIDPQLEIEMDIRHSIESPSILDIAMKERRNVKKISMSLFKSAAEEEVDLECEIQEPDVIEQEQTDSDAEASPVGETSQKRKRVKRVSSGNFVAEMDTLNTPDSTKSKANSSPETHDDKVSDTDISEIVESTGARKKRVQPVATESFTAAMNNSENSVKNQSGVASSEEAPPENTSLQDMTIDSPPINRSKTRVHSVTAESFTAAMNNSENSIKNQSGVASFEEALPENTSLQDMTIDSPPINRSKSRVQSITAESFTAALNNSESSVKNQSGNASLEEAPPENASLQDMTIDSPPINRSKSRVQSVTAESFTAALNNSESYVKNQNQSGHTSLEETPPKKTSLQDMTIDSPPINQSKSRVQSVTAESFTAALNNSESSVKNQSGHTSLEETPSGNASLQDMTIDSPPINQSKRRVKSVGTSAFAETETQVIDEQQSQNTSIVHPVTQNQQPQDMSIEVSPMIQTRRQSRRRADKSDVTPQTPIIRAQSPALSKTSSGSTNTSKQSIADSRDSSSPVVVANSSKAKRGVKPVTVDMFGELMDESLGSNKSLQLTLPVSQSSDQSGSSKQISSTKTQSAGSQENQDMTKSRTSKTSFSPVVDQKSFGKRQRVRPVSMGRFASSLETSGASDAADNVSHDSDKSNRSSAAHEASNSSVDSVPSPDKVRSKRQKKKISNSVFEQAIADKTFTVNNPDTVNSSPAKSTRKSVKDNVSHGSDRNSRSSTAHEASNSSVDSVLSPEKVPQIKQKVSIGTFEQAIVDKTFIINNPEIANIANSSPAKATRKSTKNNVSHDKDKSSRSTEDHDESHSSVDSIPSPEMVPQRRVKKKISIGAFEQAIADKTFVINSSGTEDVVNSSPAKSTRKSNKSMSTSIHQKSMATIHEGLELVEEVDLTHQDSAKNSQESLNAFAKGGIVRHSFSPSLKTQTRVATMISKTLDETTASSEEQTEGTSTPSTKSQMSSGAARTSFAFRKGGPVRHSFSPLMSPANTTRASLDNVLTKVDTPTPQRVTRKSLNAFQRHGPVRHSDSFSQPLPPMESSSNTRDSSYMDTSTQAAESTDSQSAVSNSSIKDPTADINTSNRSSVLDESNVNSSLGSVGVASPKLSLNKKRVKQVDLSTFQQFMEPESDENSTSEVSEVSDQNLHTATSNKLDPGNASKRVSKSTQDKRISTEMLDINNSRVSTRRSNTKISDIIPENTLNVSQKELSMSDKRKSIEPSETKTNNSRLSTRKSAANLSHLMSEQTANVSQRESMASEKRKSAGSLETEINNLRTSPRKSAANSSQLMSEQTLNTSQKESKKRKSTESAVTDNSRTSPRKSAANSSQLMSEQTLNTSQKESKKRKSTEPAVTENSRTSPRKSAANSSQLMSEQKLNTSQKESKKRKSTEPAVTENSRTSPRKSAANSSPLMSEQTLNTSKKESKKKKSTEPAVTDNSRSSTRKSAANSSQLMSEQTLNTSQKESKKRKSTEPAVTENSRTSPRKSAANLSQLMSEQTLNTSQKESSISKQKKSTEPSETKINSSRLSTRKSTANSSQFISERTANTSQRESSNNRKRRSIELYENELESGAENSTTSKKSKISQEREVSLSTEALSNEKATPTTETNKDNKLEFTPFEFDLALNTMKINAISVTKNLFDVSMSESSDKYSVSDFQKAFEMIDSPCISIDTSSVFEQSTMLQHKKGGDTSTASLSTNTSVAQTTVVESPNKNIQSSALKLSGTRLSRTLQQTNTAHQNKSLFSIASSRSTIHKSRKRYTLVDLQAAINSVRSPSDSLNSPSNFSSKSDVKFSIRDFEKAVTTLKQNTTLNISGLPSSSLMSSLSQQRSRNEDQTMRESLASTVRQSSISTEPRLSLDASVFISEQTIEGDATNHDKDMSNAETTLGNVSHASSLDIGNDSGVSKQSKKNFVKSVSLSEFKNLLNETQGPSENIPLGDLNATTVFNQNEGGPDSNTTQANLETSTRKSKRLSLRSSSRPSSNNTNVTEASIVSAKSRPSRTSVNTASHILTLDASSLFFQTTDTTELLPSRKSDATNIPGDTTNTGTTSRKSGATVVSANSPKSSNTFIEPRHDTVVPANSSRRSENIITPMHTGPKSNVSAAFDEIIPESSVVSATSPPDDSSESSQEEEDTQGVESDKESSQEEEDSEGEESDKESSDEEEETQVAASDKESSHEEEDTQGAESDKESSDEEETQVAASNKESSHGEEDSEGEESDKQSSDEEEETQVAASNKESSHGEVDSEGAESDKESSHHFVDEESAHSDISESAELATTESGHLADKSTSINGTPQANFSGIYPTSSGKASEKSLSSTEKSTAMSRTRRDLTQAFSTAKSVSALPQVERAAGTSGLQNQRDRQSNQPVNWVDYRKMLEKQPIEITKKRMQNVVVPLKKAKAPKRSVPIERMVDGAAFKLPRRKKTKPWITSKLCKKLETQFAKKDSLSACRITEDFIDWLSDKVTKALKSKSDSHKMARQIAKTLKKHEFIENDYDFYLFCNEYLPQAFCAKIFTYPREKFIE